MSWDAVRLPLACQCRRVGSRRNLPPFNRRRPKISASTPCKACGCGKRAELDAGAGVCSKAIRLGAVCRGECVARGDVNTTQQHSAGTRRQGRRGDASDDDFQSGGDGSGSDAEDPFRARSDRSMFMGEDAGASVDRWCLFPMCAHATSFPPCRYQPAGPPRAAQRIKPAPPQTR